MDVVNGGGRTTDGADIALSGQAKLMSRIDVTKDENGAPSLATASIHDLTYECIEEVLLKIAGT